MQLAGECNKILSQFMPPVYRHTLQQARDIYKHDYLPIAQVTTFLQFVNNEQWALAQL